MLFQQTSAVSSICRFSRSFATMTARCSPIRRVLTAHSHSNVMIGSSDTGIYKCKTQCIYFSNTKFRHTYPSVLYMYYYLLIFTFEADKAETNLQVLIFMLSISLFSSYMLRNNSSLPALLLMLLLCSYVYLEFICQHN